MSAAVTPARWLAISPCPEWCDADTLHTDDDHEDDRTHTGFSSSLRLTLATMATAAPGKQLDVSLYRYYQEAATRVWVGFDHTNRGVDLSLDEARWLVDALTERITAAEESGQ